MPQLNLDSNANLNHVLNSSSNLVKYECNSIQNPNRKRLVYILEGKYVCSCNSYFKNGLICRHIFALSNLRQDKDLTYILINKRWQQPVITDNTMQIDVDNYAFDPKRLAKFISKSLNNKEDVIEEVEAIIPEEEKLNMIEGDKEITFPTNDKSRGRPKKEKRPKSITV